MSVCRELYIIVYGFFLKKITKYKHMVGSGSSLSWCYCNNQLMKEKNMETYININKFTIFFLKLSL